MISETAPGHKENAESVTPNFPPPDELAVQEKISMTKSTDEKFQFSTAVGAEVSESVLKKEDDIDNDVDLKKSAAILIQTAIRGFLVISSLCHSSNT